MKIARTLSLAAILAASLASCGGDDPLVPAADSITVDDFVGSWTVSSLVFTNNANASEQFDIIAEGGEVRFTVLTGGGVRTWFTFADVDDEWDAQMSISGTTMTLVPAEATRDTGVWEFTLVGSTVVLTDAASSFDFTLQDAAEVAATEVVTATRN
jgi:hypothetical protein